MHYISPQSRNASFRVLRYGLLLVTLVLTGCFSGGGVPGAQEGSTKSAASTATAAGTSSTVATDVSLTGSVGDGPVTGANVRVYSNSGVLLGTAVSGGAARYSLSVKARGSDYPLRLEVSDGVDLVTGRAPDFTLVSLLYSPSDKQANINPFSTLIVKIAERMSGGLSKTNLDRARAIVLGRNGFGLDPQVIGNPITVLVQNTNAAQLVKASEALGEWIRRTRDLTGTGANAVVNALAADMTDGFLDGLGASGTNARIAAVANVAASQVLVEILGNHLRVGGVEATAVLDQSLRSTHSGISSGQLTGSVRITAGLITQARIAIAAARVLSSADAVIALAGKVDALQSGSSASSVSSVLPASSTDTLRAAVLLAPGASSSEVSSINKLVFAANDSGISVATASSTTTTSTGGATTAAAGTISLSWTAPSGRADGTPLSLSDIGGYRIYYGTATGSYSSNVQISSSTATTGKISGLVSGKTYYLAMTTYDTNGRESGYSPQLVKVAQ